MVFIEQKIMTRKPKQTYINALFSSLKLLSLEKEKLKLMEQLHKGIIQEFMKEYPDEACASLSYYKLFLSEK